MNSQDGNSVLKNAEALNRRGPDYQKVKDIALGELWCLNLYSTILHMRGELSPQPIENADTGDILMWNAEIFAGLEVIT